MSINGVLPNLFLKNLADAVDRTFGKGLKPIEKLVFIQAFHKCTFLIESWSSKIMSICIHCGRKKPTFLNHDDLLLHQEDDWDEKRNRLIIIQ